MRGSIVAHRDGSCTYLLEGRGVTQAEFEAAFPPKADFLSESAMTQSASAWPMLSEAMAVHPRQVEEATARNRKHGVAVDYTSDGRAILADRGQRRDLMRLERCHDNHGCYGD